MSEPIIILEKKELITLIEYEKVSDFFEGLAVVKSIKTGLYGYMNEEGRLEIPCIYTRATNFKNGYAIVSKKVIFNDKPDERSGIINLKNEVIIPFEYDDFASYFKQDKIIAEKDSYIYVLTKENKQIGFAIPGLIDQDKPFVSDYPCRIVLGSNFYFINFVNNEVITHY